MDKYFFLLLIFLVVLEFFFFRGGYKLIVKEWGRYKQRIDLESTGKYDNKNLQFFINYVNPYIIASIFIILTIAFLIVCYDTYTPFWLLLFYSLFPIALCFFYGKYQKEKIPRPLNKKWLLTDSVCAGFIALFIHFGLFHAIFGLINDKIDRSSCVVTVPITSKEAKEMEHKGGGKYYIYKAYFNPINPKLLANTPTRETLPMPNRLFVDILPYLSADKIFSMPHTDNQTFTNVYYSQPFEADSVRLTFIEGYYGFYSLKEHSLIK